MQRNRSTVLNLVCAGLPCQRTVGPRQGWRSLTGAAIGLLLVVALCAGLSRTSSASADHLTPLAPSNIAHVWANEGGDKVTRDELRATGDPNAVLNSAWDGTTVSLFGARNEVVAFNLVLEAPIATASNVEVSLTSLTGPGGATISTVPASGDGVFNYVGRHIELFYVRYLEIKGLSVDLAYNDYDERHIPERCRRAYDENGIGTGTWEDRPCHNKLYPDIAVPLELHTPFTIPAGSNQSIWGDIYIPETMPAGNYTGTIAVTEDGQLIWQIPILLRVRNFTLPDLPHARTMVFYSSENINDRYLGEDNMYPDPGTPEYTQAIELADRHFHLAHRHKVSLINGELEIERMDDAWTSRLNGELFTPAQGYDGVGIGVGNGVYSIGTYGSWPWQDGAQADMWAHTDPWVNWFDAQVFTTPTDTFLYLIDESDDYPQIEQWAQWMDNNPGPGQRLMSMATISLPEAMANTPSLDVPTSGAGFGITSDWENALAALRADPSQRFFMYNGSRPASGSFATEDDGVALRELAWGHYKKGVDRWFYWESTYYVNFQCYGYHDPRSHTNLFQQAQTFGCYSYDDDSRGQAGWNYFNGDGILFYPGADTRYPQESYDVQGPFASLRLKLWRRGIQDLDYLTMASAVNPTRTAEIVNEMIPKVLWEYGVDDPGDPTWVRTDISWSTDPDDWEAARAELADIIEGASACPDLDGDGDVDVVDIMLVASRWHTTVGDPDYDPACDLDDDGDIDVVDIMLVAVHWGETCTEPTPTPTFTPTPTPTPTPTAVIPSQLIQPTDLVYQGAFAYPSGDDWAYSGHALAHYPEGDPTGPADGYPGSLYAAGHAWYDLVGEITIPAPLVSDDFDGLPKASVLRALADITGGWKDNCTYNDDCIYREVDGLEVLSNINKIVWNLRDWYNVAGYDQDSLGWSELDMTGARGVWHIGEQGNDVFHNAKTCNYLFKAPESFASQYLEGKWLIAGNHRGAGAFGGSQGPTLYALAPWEDGNPPESGQNLDAVALLYYPEIYPECLDNPDECYFPDYRPKDDWGGGAWVQTAGKSGILIFGRKGLGDNCYGTTEECGGDPCDMSKGYHAYPYEPQILFYDPEELKEVIAGTREPWEVVPYEIYSPVNEVIDQECAILGAAAYDQARGLIYVTEQEAGPWGETVVHVWEVLGDT